MDQMSKAYSIQKTVRGHKKVWVLSLVGPIFSIADETLGSHFAMRTVSMKEKVIPQLKAEFVPLKIGVAGLELNQSFDEKAETIMITKNVVELAMRVGFAQGTDPVARGGNGGLVVRITTPLKVKDVAVHDDHLASFEMLMEKIERVLPTGSRREQMKV